MLQLLAQAKGKVLQREEIYQAVWGYAMAHGDRSVDVFIRKVRQKLEKASPDWNYIHTHFGVGYRFEPERRGDGDIDPLPPSEPRDLAERRGHRRVPRPTRALRPRPDDRARIPRSSSCCGAELHESLRHAVARPRAADERPPATRSKGMGAGSGPWASEATTATSPSRPPDTTRRFLAVTGLSGRAKWTMDARSRGRAALQAGSGKRRRNRGCGRGAAGAPVQAPDWPSLSS